ncbi:flavin-containing amine oxidase [Coccidioides posadasii str. Silveira]|uniref:Flavin-containing amine oxidase n=2 Tax=Coccidioides posadasii TaxID=199306 RepID=E9DHE1_COCPS|nr:flavin-containing amine oxidase [Coccidioides posadasii str. Silveira]KMM65899.1 flowering locus D [Coccidioides posadasii RMSCC 3488]
MDGSASINAESSSETVKSVESEIPPMKTKSSIEVDGGVSGSRDLPAPVALTKTATSESEDGKMGILTSNDGVYGDDRKNEVGSNQLTDMFPLSTSYPEDDSSQGSSELCKELGRFSESHDTPNGSTTSASLISPFSTEKSITPSAQLNQTLNTPPASAPVSAPSSSRKKQQQPPLSSHTEARPRSSIPTRMAPTLYAEQCLAAAYASRLNPYALHKDEQEILQDSLCHLHVTTYLNIRNGILRLWTRNPMLTVTEEEALGCAKDRRWMNLASVAYDWLVRNGYINFGCVSISKNPRPTKRRRRREGPTIVVIGAGMAGLGCARQLESLFQHYGGDTAPAKVIVLEGRKRIGGRIYSHPLQSLKPGTLVPNLRPTAEMGAQIIVGFDNGNPLDPIIRAQLALHCHLLRDISTIYDTDGSPVDEVHDSLVEKLYNDILNRCGIYRHKAVINKTAGGDRELMHSARDCLLDDGITIRQYEDAAASGTVDLLLPAKRLRRGVGHRAAEIGPTVISEPVVAPQISHVEPANGMPAALTCQAMGWNLREGASNADTLLLDEVAGATKTQTLGAVMDEAIRQCHKWLPLTPKDMRLLNWHYANLEYANAANLGKLSLAGWDQDMGNEFEGEHAQVIGGYQQVPRGLWSHPSKLDVRPNKVVTKISYKVNGSPNGKARIYLDDGEVITADKVVLTAPLGVLKSKSITFSPPLPAWKTGAIDRLGFGTMNKVILVFEKPFWDVERDMIGLLREPAVPESLSQADYASSRGRFYLFWNCMKTSGLPMLIALMAGDSAHHAEALPDSEILHEVTSQLRNIFKGTAVPDPLETIVTRWGQDRFSRGSYSYVAAESLPGDYDLMAKSTGNLYFAGEATCGTHPATVHGAYLSGLRVAKEVLESVIGPIKVPTPLVVSKTKTPSTHTPVTPPAAAPEQTMINPKKRKEPQSSSVDHPNSTERPAATPSGQGRPVYEMAFVEEYRRAISRAIQAELGDPEKQPRKEPINPFLLFQKDYWFVCKARCDEVRRRSTGNPAAKTPRDEVRQALGQMWREASEEVRRRYLDQIEINRKINNEKMSKWKERITVWERHSAEIKDRWCAANPYSKFVKEMDSQKVANAKVRTYKLN